jgi:hypothetical protein
MTPKSHHYNPRVYLHQFKKPGTKKELWEYDLIKGTARLSSPKHSGCEDYYHSIETPNGRYDTTIESSFSDLENRLNDLFELIRHQREMPLEAWLTFFRFAALQRSRGPKFMDLFQRQLNDVFTRVYESFKTTPQFDAKMLEIGFDPEQLGKSNVSVKVARSTVLTSALDIYEEGHLFVALARKKWGFIIAPPDTHFWTSDDPLCCWAKRESSGPFSHIISPLDRDVEITFPMSRRICAFGATEIPLTQLYTDATANQVETINTRTVLNGWHFVYGPSNDPAILDLVKKIAKGRSEKVD